MTTDILPAGETGSHRITAAQMSSADWSTIKEFEKALLDEAIRRGLQISVSDEIDGTLLARWRPDRMRNQNDTQHAE